MKIGIYYVVSSTAAAKIANETNYPWIEELAKLSGNEIEVTDLDHINDYDFVLDFIGSGGTEGLFLKVIDKLPKPCFLLTTGANNSLAASLEILSYLRNNSLKGEILHGSNEYIARRINEIGKVIQTKKKLDGIRIARVGEPSDWLIASLVNEKEAKLENNMEIIDISMDEFINEINKNSYIDNDYTRELKTKEFNNQEIEKALYIYGALRRLSDKYKLSGLTVRCFDLLNTVHSTSCLALGILNAEGIYASCEGDIPSLISMIILGELTNKPVFMANPSKIDVETNEIILAHCTLPVNMSNNYRLMTHFESQIGVAIKAEIEKGRVTVFKTNGLMDNYFVSGGDLICNLNEYNLCRTQIKLKLDKSVNYFLKNSIGNHHMIINGDYASLIDDYFNY